MNVDNQDQPQPVHAKVSDAVNKSSIFHSIQKMTAWVMIISAVLFALIGILGIWQVFGSNSDDTIGRAFGSLLVIAFASMIVNVASRTAESKR